MLDIFRGVFAPPRDLLLLVAAGWLGLSLAGRRARRSGDEQALDALTSVMTLAFIAGGRLLFAAEHLTSFAASPLSLFALNVDLFDPWGALASSLLAGAVLIQRRRLPAWHMLDLLTPLLACLAIGLGLSHLASGAAFGSETNAPWAIPLWGAARHPTQVYEVLAGLAIFFVIWFRGPGSRPGMTFLLWLALSAASRLLIEAFRGDSTLVLGGLRLAQILAWAALLASMIAAEVLAAAPRKESTAPAGNRAP